MLNLFDGLSVFDCVLAVNMVATNPLFKTWLSIHHCICIRVFTFIICVVKLSGLQSPPQIVCVLLVSVIRLLLHWNQAGARILMCDLLVSIYLMELDFLTRTVEITLPLKKSKYSYTLFSCHSRLFIWEVWCYSRVMWWQHDKVQDHVYIYSKDGLPLC